MSKWHWRRLTACCVIVTQLTSAIAFAQDHTPDLGQVRTQMELLRALTANAPETIVGTPSEYDEATLNQLYAQGKTPEAHTAANIQRIKECEMAENVGYAGLTPKERTECQGVLTVARAHRKPNPYLDKNDPKFIGEKLKQEAKAAHDKAEEDISRGRVDVTNAISTQFECSEKQEPLPAIQRADVCNVDKPAEGKTCDIPVAITVADRVIGTTRDEAACIPLEKDAKCEVGEEECSEYTRVNISPEGEEPEYVTVCSKFVRGYTCWQPDKPWNVSWPCQRLEADPNCMFVGESPLKFMAGKPVLAENHYTCAFTPPDSARIGTNCSTKVCIGDTCTSTPAQKNPDFANAMVGMEVLRQGGVYACDRQREECVDETVEAEAQQLKLFSGVVDRCRDPIIGTNCCSSSDGDSLKTNRQVLPSVTDVFIENALGNTHLASNYVYDFMFTKGGDWMMDKAIDAWSSGAWDPGAGFNLRLSLYGFTLSYGGGAGGGFLANMLGGDSIIGQGLNLFGEGGNLFTITDIMGIEGLNLGFNPYVLALQIAIFVIQQLMSCTVDEKMLAMRRGGDLCVKLGRKCAKKIPIIGLCIVYVEAWCCWNSRLAKIIGTYGAAQLGMGRANCAGFTPEQLAQIDFSRLPLDQFMNEIMRTAKLPGTDFTSRAMTHSDRRREDAINSVDPAVISEQVIDPDLVDYTADRIRFMLGR